MWISEGKGIPGRDNTSGKLVKSENIVAVI